VPNAQGTSRSLAEGDCSTLENSDIFRLVCGYGADGISGWFYSFYCSVERIAIPISGIHTVTYWGNNPSITANFDILFTASGSPSVNNPIQVHVALTNTNVSNLLQYYNRVYFTNAYDSSNPSKNQMYTIALKSSQTVGEYVGDGTLYWDQETGLLVELIADVAQVSASSMRLIETNVRYCV
jgi:hypothetical protein